MLLSTQTISANTGRIGAMVKTEKDIYILAGTAEDALRQIKDRHYAAPYRNDMM